MHMSVSSVQYVYVGTPLIGFCHNIIHSSQLDEQAGVLCSTEECSYGVYKCRCTSTYLIVNPRRPCVARVTVLGLLSVTAILAPRAIEQTRQKYYIGMDFKKAIFLKPLCSKVTV